MMKPKGSQFSLFSDDEIDASTQSYRTAMADQIVRSVNRVANSSGGAGVDHPLFHESLSTGNWSRSDYLTLMHNPPEAVRETPRGQAGGWYEQPWDFGKGEVVVGPSEGPETMAHEVAHHMHIANSKRLIETPLTSEDRGPSPFLEGVANGVSDRVHGLEPGDVYEHEWGEGSEASKRKGTFLNPSHTYITNRDAAREGFWPGAGRHGGPQIEQQELPF